MIEPIVFALLNGGSVGDLTGSRIYPDAAQVNSDSPCVVYQVSTKSVWQLNGPTGQSSIDLKIFAYASNEANCRAIAEAVVETLDGYSDSRIVYLKQESADGGDVDGGYEYQIEFSGLTRAAYLLVSESGSILSAENGSRLIEEQQ